MIFWGISGGRSKNTIPRTDFRSGGRCNVRRTANRLQHERKCFMSEWEDISEDHVAIIEKARKRVIESIGKNMDLYGITLSIGHLYGTMFFSDSPMTLDEMGKAMAMSKTSMSTGVRTLMDLKMVNKVWGKGSRKDLYEVETDWYQTFFDYFTIKWSKSIEINMHALNKSIRELEELRRRHSEQEALCSIIERDLKKIQGAVSYYIWLEKLIETFENGDIYNYIPREPEPGESDSDS